MSRPNEQTRIIMLMCCLQSKLLIIMVNVYWSIFAHCLMHERLSIFVLYWMFAITMLNVKVKRHVTLTIMVAFHYLVLDFIPWGGNSSEYINCITCRYRCNSLFKNALGTYPQTFDVKIKRLFCISIVLCYSNWKSEVGRVDRICLVP